MDDLEYLFTAFAVVWIIVYGYILVLFLRQRRLRQQIEMLQERITSKQHEPS